MMIDITRKNSDIEHPMYEMMESALSSGLGYCNASYLMAVGGVCLTGLSSWGLTRTAKLVKCLLWQVIWVSVDKSSMYVTPLVDQPPTIELTNVQLKRLTNVEVLLPIGLLFKIIENTASFGWLCRFLQHRETLHVVVNSSTIVHTSFTLNDKVIGSSPSSIVTGMGSWTDMTDVMEDSLLLVIERALNALHLTTYSHTCWNQVAILVKDF